MNRRILKERFDGSGNQIFIKIFVGVEGTEQLKGHQKWDSTKVGKVEWEEEFDIYSFEGQNKVLKLCDDLRKFQLTKETEKVKRRTTIKPIAN